MNTDSFNEDRDLHFTVRNISRDQLLYIKGYQLGNCFDFFDQCSQQNF